MYLFIWLCWPGCSSFPKSSCVAARSGNGYTSVDDGLLAVNVSTLLELQRAVIGILQQVLLKLLDLRVEDCCLA